VGYRLRWRSSSAAAQGWKMARSRGWNFARASALAAQPRSARSVPVRMAARTALGTQVGPQVKGGSSLAVKVGNALALSSAATGPHGVELRSRLGGWTGGGEPGGAGRGAFGTVMTVPHPED
jgi:hypothetical protein